MNCKPLHRARNYLSRVVDVKKTRKSDVRKVNVRRRSLEKRFAGRL